MRNTHKEHHCFCCIASFLAASCSSWVSTSSAGSWTYRTTDPRMKQFFTDSCNWIKTRQHICKNYHWHAEKVLTDTNVSLNDDLQCRAPQSKFCKCQQLSGRCFNRCFYSCIENFPFLILPVNVPHANGCNTHPNPGQVFKSLCPLFSKRAFGHCDKSGYISAWAPKNILPSSHSFLLLCGHQSLLFFEKLGTFPPERTVHTNRNFDQGCWK